MQPREDRGLESGTSVRIGLNGADRMQVHEKADGPCGDTGASGKSRRETEGAGLGAVRRGCQGKNRCRYFRASGRFIGSHVDDRIAKAGRILKPRCAADVGRQHIGRAVITGVDSGRTGLQAEVPQRGIHEAGVGGDVAVDAGLIGARAAVGASIFQVVDVVVIEHHGRDAGAAVRSLIAVEGR